jgi:ketopantoate reductase
MRVLMVGAGPAAALLTRFLEAQKGNEVTHYVRSGRKQALSRFKLVDARTGAIQVREKPTVVEPEQVLTHFDLMVLAVRASQLDEALTLAERVPGQPRIATLTQGPDDVAHIRARLPGRPAVQIGPMFVAWPEDDTIRWWNPPLGRALVSGEGDAESQKLAEELAAIFKATGLPARAVATAKPVREAARLLRPLLQVALRTPFLPADVKGELRRRLEGRPRV